MDWRRRGKGEGGGDRQGAPSDNPGNAWEGILPASSRVVAPHPRLQTFRRSSVLLSDSWHELSEATLAPYPEDKRHCGFAQAHDLPRFIIGHAWRNIQALRRRLATHGVEAGHLIPVLTFWPLPPPPSGNVRDELHV